MDSLFFFFLHMYLHYKDLRLSHKTLALVSFEQWCDILETDLAVVGVNVIIFTMAQEDE